MYKIYKIGNDSDLSLIKCGNIENIDNHNIGIDIDLSIYDNICTHDEIIILGCGDSVKEWNGEGISIGVNDIYRYFETDYLVCVDRPSDFTEERKKIIYKSNPKIFFSQVNDWKKDNFVKLYLKFSRNIKLEFPIFRSYTSPLTACAIAVLIFKCKRIYIYGADYLTHKKLNNLWDKIKNNFIDFRDLCYANNIEIYTGTKNSRLIEVLEYNNKYSL